MRENPRNHHNMLSVPKQSSKSSLFHFQVVGWLKSWPISSLAQHCLAFCLGSIQRKTFTCRIIPRYLSWFWLLPMGLATITSLAYRLSTLYFPICSRKDIKPFQIRSGLRSKHCFLDILIQTLFSNLLSSHRRYTSQKLPVVIYQYYRASIPFQLSLDPIFTKWSNGGSHFC